MLLLPQLLSVAPALSACSQTLSRPYCCSPARSFRHRLLRIIIIIGSIGSAAAAAATFLSWSFSLFDFSRSRTPSATPRPAIATRWASPPLAISCLQQSLRRPRPGGAVVVHRGSRWLAGATEGPPLRRAHRPLCGQSHRKRARAKR